MKIKMLKLLAASSLFMTLAACGGGGGASTPQGTNTVLSGVASKGPFLKDSTVNVYAVVNGAKGSLIVQTKTSDNNGSYSANLGSYTGPVIVEVSGSYQDEATGRTVTLAGTAPIRAALPNVQGSVTLPVTPLTELAVQKSASLAPDAISAANSMVSGLFKVDITGTLPVAPTSTGMAGASQAQIDYTLALAAVSQLASQQGGASDAANLQTALSTLCQGLSGSGMTADASAAFQGALNSFVTGNANNQTGISNTSGTSLVNAGTLSKSYTLTLQGNSGAVHGIQFDLTLPEGVTVNFNSMASTMLESSLVLSAGLPSDLLLADKYTSGVLSVGLLTLKGMNAGTFATVTCNIPSGETPPAASALLLTNLKVVDGNGNVMSGATVTVN